MEEKDKSKLPFHLIEIGKDAVEKLIPSIVWPWDTSANYFIGNMNKEDDYYNCYLDEEFVIVVVNCKGSDKSQRVFKYSHFMDVGY